MRFVAQLLRKIQHTGLRDAIVMEYATAPDAARLLRLQADDIHQVATMLEEKIDLFGATPKPRRKKK